MKYFAYHMYGLTHVSCHVTHVDMCDKMELDICQMEIDVCRADTCQSCVWM